MALGGVSKTLHALLWPTILGWLAAWVVAIVGLAGLQHRCGDADGGVGAYTAGNWYPDAKDCRGVYSFNWWALAIDLPILFLILASTVGNRLNNMRTALVGLIAVAAVLEMIMTERHLAQWRTLNEANVGENGVRYAKVAFSGFLATSFFKLLSILILGTREHHDHEKVTYAAPAAYPTSCPAGTTPQYVGRAEPAVGANRV